MTVVCATSDDLAAVKKLITATDERASEGLRVLEVRINALESALNRLRLREATADYLSVPGGERSPETPGPKPVLEIVVAGVSTGRRLALTREMHEGLNRFVEARLRAYGEEISYQQAVRTMIDEGLRAAKCLP